MVILGKVYPRGKEGLLRALKAFLGLLAHAMKPHGHMWAHVCGRARAHAHVRTRMHTHV
jgi:hypothetical protein